MKLTFVLLTVALLQVQARGLSQTITLSGKNLGLQQIFTAIEKQTGYVVFYNKGILTDARPVNISVRAMPLTDFLEITLKDQPFTYLIADKTISLSRKAVPAGKNPQEGEVITADSSAPGPVRGRISDGEGNPLAEINVVLKGSQVGTVSDANGFFTITAQAGSILVFSSVEYETRELKVKAADQDAFRSNTLLVSLKRKITSLNEVVINQGYYTRKQRENTGNVSTVTSEDIEKQPVTSPLAALEGRVPGLLITQASGAPGRQMNVQLRGRNSIASNNNPLYLVDGVPFGSATMDDNINFIGASGTNSDPFDILDIHNIESITVLKDADATAIYGSRGANGVILITTKKGRLGKTKVDINASTGWGHVTRTTDLLNTQQYLAMRHEAFRNDGTTPSSTDYDINGVWDTTRHTDWTKVLIGGTAAYTNIAGSISGGNQYTQFLLGLGYNRQTTIYPGDSYAQKGSVNLSLTHTSENGKFKTQVTVLYSKDKNLLPQYDVGGNISLPPDAPALYTADGKLNWENSTFNNPLSTTLQKFRALTDNLNTTLNLSYQLIDGLELSSNFGYRTAHADQLLTSPKSAYDPQYTYIQSTANYVTNDIHTWIIEPQLNFRRNIGKGKFNVTLGSTFQENISNLLAQTGTGYSSDALIEDLAAAASRYINVANYTQYRYDAFFGRVGYNWEDKYLVNLTARRDGSSRFGPGRQFANFGAAGLGWIFSSEKFAKKGLPFLSFGKLRASYGITGNDQTSDYQFLDSYAATPISYLGSTGLYPVRLLNKDYGWETNKKLEIGLELGFIKNRIQLSASYYRNRSSDQLLSYPLPSITGSTSIVQNLPAVVQNMGVELQLTTVNIKGKDFLWSSSFTVSIPRNKLIAFPNLDKSSYASAYVVGQSLFNSKRYRSTGVDPQTGTYSFYDYDHDGSITYPNDWKSVIYTGVQYYGGWQNTLQYKSWQLDAFFHFVRQRYGSNFQAAGFGVAGAMSNQPEYVLNRWQKKGDQTPVGKFTNADFDAVNAYYNFTSSDGIYSDASFVRLRTLAISYSLPAGALQKCHLTRARLYFQGENVFTFTGYKGADPETKSALPPLRQLTVGIQVTL